MARSTPRFLTPGADTLLGRWFGKQLRHPAEFLCAVRVIGGDLPGERRSWSYRRSAIDTLPPSAGVVLLQHGDTLLTLRFTGGPTAARGLRPHHVAWAATEVSSGARVEVGGDVEHADTFGLDG